jgi:hypothetical protein
MAGNKAHKRERDIERDLGREGERSDGERKWRGSFEKMAWVDLTDGLNQHLGVCLVNN